MPKQEGGANAKHHLTCLTQKPGVLVLFAGYFKALSSTFLRAALPRSMPHTSDSLTRYSKTSESSSPRTVTAIFLVIHKSYGPAEKGRVLLLNHQQKKCLLFSTKILEKKFERLEIAEYHSKKKVPGAMKLLPISLLRKIIHLLLQKIKAHAPFFSCHLKKKQKRRMNSQIQREKGFQRFLVRFDGICVEIYGYLLLLRGDQKTEEVISIPEPPGNRPLPVS
nr:hypothetical protein Iba_chr12dCG16230 [Ipomoea batatas]